MLHGVFHEGEVLTSDWLYVERWALDPAGEVLTLDVPRGVYLQPEGPVRWLLRNPGQVDLHAELWAERARISAFTVGAGELVEVGLTAEQRAAALAPDEPRTNLAVRIYDAEVPDTAEPLSSTSLVLAQRQPDKALPPASGDPFPALTLANEDGEHYTPPTAGGSQTIWFWPDCAMIWPQLEDVAWLERSGRDLGRGDPILITEFEVVQSGFTRRWALDGATIGMWGDAATSTNEANAGLGGDDLYWASFFIDTMPGDAMPTDYVIDVDGTIRSIERMYRGPWSLAVAWPWE